jgi:hypothetical protein
MAGKEPAKDERRYPRLSEEEKKRILRELKEEQDAGLVHPKSEGYPSLGSDE